MRITPDSVILWSFGPIHLDLTIATTWAIMLALVLVSRAITSHLRKEPPFPRWQTAAEVIVSAIRGQMREIGLPNTAPYLPFIATLFIFIATSNLCAILPFYEPPTGSLSTTAALALCVFMAVPFFGIREQGSLAYLKSYLEPTPIMLPFNIIGELARTLALAIRLFGNIMSGSLVGALLLSLAPFIFPIIMNLLGLLTGTVQAYIFSILATVFIAAGVGSHEEKTPAKPDERKA